VITGAVGDFGKTAKVNSAGKADSKGNYTNLVLKKGTILVNSTQLQAVLQNGQPTDFNTATCSASLTGSAPVPIVSGTKAYSGITGSVTLNVMFAEIGPRTSNGQCNMSNNANPIAQYGSLTGTGTVSFG
jgi:hypothetical protein